MKFFNHTIEVITILYVVIAGEGFGFEVAVIVNVKGNKNRKTHYTPWHEELPDEKIRVMKEKKSARWKMKNEEEKYEIIEEMAEIFEDAKTFSDFQGKILVFLESPQLLLITKYNTQLSWIMIKT